MLERQRPAAGEVDVRGWEWRHLWKCCQSGAAFEIAKPGDRVLTALFTADGKSVVTFESGGKVSIRDAAPGAKPTVLQDRESKTPFLLRSNSGFLTMSDDGAMMAAVGCKSSDDYCVRVWDMRQRTLLTTLTAEKIIVTAIAISPDKSTLAAMVASHDEVWIWDIATQQRRRTIPIKRGWDSANCGALCYSHHGKTLAIGDSTGRVLLFDVETGTTRNAPFRFAGQTMALAFSPDDRVLAAGSAYFDPNILIWDLASQRVAKALAHNGFIAHLAFSPDGNMLVSASGDQTVRLWVTKDWSAATVLMGHTDEVWSAAFSPDGKQIVSACKDGGVFVWEKPPGQPRNSGTKTLPFSSFRNVDVSPDGKTFVTVANGVVHLAEETDTAHEELGTNNVVAFWASPDEVVIGAKDPLQIKVWNVKEKDAAAFPLKSSTGNVWFGYLAQSRMMVAAVYDPSAKATTVTRWDVATRRELSSRTGDFGYFEGGNYRISQDGRTMVRSFDVGGVQMLDLTTGQASDQFTVRTMRLQGLALSPDGKTIATAGVDSPEIKVWDVTTRKLNASLHGHNLVVLHLAYSPDGQRMMSSSIGAESVKVWDTQGWQQVSRLNAQPGKSLSLPGMLSDGNTIAAKEYEPKTGNSRIRVWQSASWEEINAAEAGNKPDQITQ